MTAHWGVEDPASVTGDEKFIQEKFNDVARLLKRRIELLVCLPLKSLDKVSLQKQLQDIGKK
jgi:arsenate reductase